MTLVELMGHLRESLLDDTGGTGVAWEDLTNEDVESEQLRWSNEELTRFIDEAQNRAARSSFLIKKSETAFDISVIAGTAEYSLDSRIIRLKDASLSSTGRSLDPVEYEDMIGSPFWRTETGTPVQYIIDESDKVIRLYPIPVANDTISFIYYRLPLSPLDWNDSTTDIEIPSEYQIEMLDYAAHLAYQKDEANTFDPQRSEYFRQKFASNFSTTSVYGELRRKRSRGRTVGYGGIPQSTRRSKY